MVFSSRVFSQIRRLMRDPDALRAESQTLQRAASGRRFDPQQPRIPAGHSDGGRWMRRGGSHAPLRERETKHPQELPHQAPFDQGGDLANGELPVVLAAAKATNRRPSAMDFVGAFQLSLYAEMSARNGPNRWTIMSFRANQFGRTGVGIEHVDVLDRNELEKWCPFVKEVQEFTNDAARKVKESGAHLSPQQFGTAVHTLVANRIRDMNHPDLRAEVSVLKTVEAGGNPKLARYGQKGSIRYDAFERMRSRDAVCIHDIKTGLSGLTNKRMYEMAGTAWSIWPEVRNFFVIQIAPWK